MAGDWIKVEVATLDKPEVVRMAELLGVKRDEMIGILFRFWAWLDRSTGNGVVTHTSRFGVDEVMHCAGFSAALESVEWCKFDNEALTLAVPGFDKHNGNPAKTRALGRDRKREYDERKSNAECVTKEEKRRDTTTSLRSVVVREPLTTPTDRHVQLAADNGVSCQAEFEKYGDWLAATGKKHKDPVAGFSMWLRKAGEFRRKDAAKVSVHDRRAEVAAGHFRDTNEPVIRDITADAKRVA